MDLVTISLAIIFIIILRIWFYLWQRKQFIHNYESKCVFITGTDTGFGRALAIALDKKGVKVYAGCFTEDGMQSLKDESSDRMKYVKVDVTDEKSLLAAKEFIEADLGVDNQRLWGLVNNAGIATGAVFHMAKLDDYKTCMNVNFFGVINTTEMFLPLLKNSKGRIVNVISISRRMPTVVEPYACSKVAIAVYNDGLRRYMKDYGIHVAGIEPGFFQTSMTNESVISNIVERNWQQLPENLRTEYGNEFKAAAQKEFAAIIVNPPLSQFNHIDLVSDAMTNALFSKNPKTSYIIGIDAHLLYRFGMFIPDYIMDLIMRFKYSNTIRALQHNLKKIKKF